MNPAELFGKLPVELRKMVLDPKQTGVVVAKQNIKVVDIINTLNRFQKDRMGIKNIINDSQKNIFAKYIGIKSLKESGKITREEFIDTINIMNKELGKPFFVNGEKKKNIALQKNFKNAISKMLDFGIRTIDNSYGSGYSIIQMLVGVLRATSENTKGYIKGVRDNFLKAVNTKFVNEPKQEQPKTQKQIENSETIRKVKAYLLDNKDRKFYPRNQNFFERANNNWGFWYSQVFEVLELLDKSVKVKIEEGNTPYRSDSEIGEIKKIPYLTFKNQAGIDNADLLNY